MIDKPSIIVTSIGRTGTKFFADLFANIIPDATSLHEPDILNFSLKKGKGIKYLKKQLQDADLRNLILKKSLGKWSLVGISDKLFCNEINADTAARLLFKQRHNFIESRKGKYYIESNVGYYGLLDVLPKTFKNHKAVYIIRDGRDWVASNMKWGEMYGKGKLRSILAHNWPEAKDIANDEYYYNWSHLTRFEKLCWAWSRLNKYAINKINQNPNAMGIRFEDIFLAEEKYYNFKQLLEFLSEMPGKGKINYNNFDGWLNNKIHSSNGYYPDWNDWTKEQKIFFENVCGPIMKEVGYKL